MGVLFRALRSLCDGGWCRVLVRGASCFPVCIFIGREEVLRDLICSGCSSVACLRHPFQAEFGGFLNFLVGRLTMV